MGREPISVSDMLKPLSRSKYKGTCIECTARWMRGKRFTGCSDDRVLANRTSPYHTTLRLTIHSALTRLEEKISMPLQTLYLAVFDMIMFRIVDEAMPEGE